MPCGELARPQKLRVRLLQSGCIKSLALVRPARLDDIMISLIRVSTGRLFHVASHFCLGVLSMHVVRAILSGRHSPQHPMAVHADFATPAPALRQRHSQVAASRAVRGLLRMFGPMARGRRAGKLRIR